MWRNHEYVTIIHDQTEYFIAFGPFTHLDRELHILAGQNSVCVHTVLVSVVRNKHTFVTGTHVLWNHRDTVRRCNTSGSHQCFYYANLMLLSIYVSVFMCVLKCACWPLWRLQNTNFIALYSVYCAVAIYVILMLVSHNQTPFII